MKIIALKIIISWVGVLFLDAAYDHDSGKSPWAIILNLSAVVAFAAELYLIWGII